MKKFFVALLVLAIVAGNLFAEVSWGGYALNQTILANGSTEKDSDVKAGGGLYGLGRIFANAANDEGTFGAYVRTGVNTGDSGVWGGAIRSYAWWQPISQVKLQIGFFGDMALQQTVGWGFHANDSEDTVAFNAYGARLGRSAWSYGGEHTGVLLALAPIEGLSIKLGLPVTAEGKAAETYNKLQAQVTYDIANIGQIAVTFAGNNNRIGKFDLADAQKPGFDYETVPVEANAVYGQFYLTAVENLSLNVGVKYTLPVSEQYTVSGVKVDVTRNSPIGAGFGAAYAVSDTFGVKARLGATFAGSVDVKTDADDQNYKDALKIGFDLMPYFDVGVVKIFLNMGIEAYVPDEKDVDSRFDWYFNPYITKSAGGGTFYAGFQLFSSQSFKTATDASLITTANPNGEYTTKKVDENLINWAIPIGIIVGF